MGVTACDDSTGKSGPGPVGPDGPDKPDPTKPGGGQTEALPKNFSDAKIKIPSARSDYSYTNYEPYAPSNRKTWFNLAMEDIQPALKAQNNTTRTAFNNWSGTSGKSATYRSKMITAQNGIFENLRDHGLEAGFLAGYGTYDLGFGAGKGALDSHYENMENAIYELFNDDAKKADFQKAMTALKFANYIKIRYQGDQGVSKVSELNTCLSAIGIDPVPIARPMPNGNQAYKTYCDMLVQIEKYLIDNMPKEAGGVDFRFNILLQIRDFHELKSFTQNMIDLGVSPTVSSVNKKTRSQIQTENGLFNSPELLSELA
ncbi:MAG: hypothetical protein LBH44_13530 [Treponema sp.]|nr:hypothetical protein [Treponema sp.]